MTVKVQLNWTNNSEFLTKQYIYRLNEKGVKERIAVVDALDRNYLDIVADFGSRTEVMYYVSSVYTVNGVSYESELVPVIADVVTRWVELDDIPLEFNVGETVQLGYTTNFTPIDNVVYSVTPSNIVTVDANGLVSIIGVGDFTIEVVVNGISSGALSRTAMTDPMIVVSDLSSVEITTNSPLSITWGDGLVTEEVITVGTKPGYKYTVMAPSVGLPNETDILLKHQNGVDSLESISFNGGIKEIKQWWLHGYVASGQTYPLTGLTMVEVVPDHAPPNTTSFHSLFQNATSFNQDISIWDTTNVTNMDRMFRGCTNFNQNINSWNVSKVTAMTNMFLGCTNFNQPLDTWDVSNVTNTSYMFSGCNVFNQSLNNWNTSNVTNTSYMFYTCSNFNQPLNNWNTGKVTNMNRMFYNCTNFNQPLDNWNTSKVTNMSNMFYTCSNFNQDISFWCVPLVVSKPTNFSVGSNLPLEYEPVWGTCPRGEIYTDDESILELQEGTFITTSGGTLTFANGSTRSFAVGVSATYTVTAAQAGKTNFKNTSANYVARGTSLVKVLHYPRNATTIKHENSPNLIEVPASLPPNVTVLTSTFNNCSSFNHPNISKWDVSNVTSMSGMFRSCTNFNQNINSWNVSKVTAMTNMFYGCTSFNQPLNTWDTGNVTDMSYVFYGCTNFDQSLNTWDVSKVTTMSYMFWNCTNFNQPLDNWNTSNVTSMSLMFYSCPSFNQPLDNWDTSKVANMTSMFYNCTNFNQPLDNWNTGNVTNMYAMFYNCTNFNQPLNNWNTGNVTNMSYMFRDCTNFSQDLSLWCVPLIYVKPVDFNSNALNLTANKLPVWGTCPRGEYLV